MTDLPSPHEGIELDTIDLSQFNRGADPQSPSPGKPQKIDYKNFVRDILLKLFKDESFLSFSSQITDVNKILKMKYSSAGDIADVILKDVALTSKLLKLVNSSFYGQFSNKGVGTISEAMIILGTEEIKLAAASLKIYELMQDVANMSILKEKTLRAMQRSLMARQIVLEENIGDAESIQISAMLYDFGEYLVAMFSPEVYINIEIEKDDKNISREQASKSLIGISYSDLGRYIASKWHLPPSVIQAMKPVSNFDIDRSRLSAAHLQRYICSFANELCNVNFSGDGKGVGKKIVMTASRYEKSLGIPAAKSVELLKTSWEKITKHAAILKFDPEEV